MAKLHYKLLILCLLIAAFAVLVAPRLRAQKPRIESKAIAQTFAETAPSQKITEILSPDGKQVLIMKEEVGKESTTETFSISDEPGGGSHKIFSKTLTEGNVISVPYNTFSPDNKYIFLKEAGASGVRYFALGTSKEGLPMEFTNFFNEKFPDYKITDVTGWGGITLIVFNVDNKDGTVGPSFWYDVASNSFIRLSDRFN